jgi:hypothetical protein
MAECCYAVIMLSAIMLSATMLSAIMLIAIMLSAFMLSAIMLSTIMLSAIMLNITCKPFMLRPLVPMSYIFSSSLTVEQNNLECNKRSGLFARSVSDKNSLVSMTPWVNVIKQILQKFTAILD